MNAPDNNSAELWITIAVLLTGGAIIAAMSWLERRPRQSLQPRLIPTTPVLFLGVIIAFLAVVHLMNLWGIQTGRH